MLISVQFPLCIDQGSILDTKVDVLNHRLRGLCDNVDIDRETFDEKEMVFSIRGEQPVSGSDEINVFVFQALPPNPSHCECDTAWIPTRRFHGR